MTSPGLCFRLLNAVIKALNVFTTELVAIRDDLKPDEVNSPDDHTDEYSRRAVSFIASDFASQLPDEVDLTGLAGSTPSSTKRPLDTDTPRSYGQDPKRARTSTFSGDNNLPFMAAFLYITGMNGNTVATWEQFVEFIGEHTELKATGLRTKFRTKMQGISESDLKEMARVCKKNNPHIYNKIKESWADFSARNSKTPTKSKSTPKKDDSSQDFNPKEFAMMMKLMKRYKGRKVNFEDSDSD